MSEKAECVVPQTLINGLKDNKMIQIAEQNIKDSGLDWRVPFKLSDRVTIIGPNHDILKFAIECLESMMDKDRNPACFLLQDKKIKFHFSDTLGEKIFDSRQELLDKHMSVSIEKVPHKYVTLECSFEEYSKIRPIIDYIRHSIPSSGSRVGSLDKSLVGAKSQQNGCLGSFLANKHSAVFYSFNANEIKVNVYKASIIEVTGIDAIVNAANENLDYYGGIALAICMAAGPSVKFECSDYVSRKGRVRVGNCCVTGSGNLKHLKGIIHAVGPRWDAYTDKKKCALDLHETVVHILQTAHERKFHKIALPAISSGMFHVPLDICAKMYVKAVMNYSRDATPNCVTEVHFVDLNENILREIKCSHEKRQRSLKHAGGQGGARRQPESKLYSCLRDVEGHPGLHFVGASHVPCEVHYIGEETLSFGVQQTIFRVENRVAVRIYSGSIVKVSGVDALVCSVRTDLKGGKLAAAFESAGGTSYTKALNDLKRLHPSVGDVVVLMESGSLKSKYILLAIMESKRITVMDAKTAQKLKDLYVKILETANTYGMKKIALTLLGSGTFVNDVSNLECCCHSLLKGLTSSQFIRSICVEDIHVVNFHPEVTDTIVRVFHQQSSHYQARSNFKVGGSNSSGGRMPEKKSDLQICCTQSQRVPKEDKTGERRKERAKYASMHVPSSLRISQDENDNYNQCQESRQKPVDDGHVKAISEQLPKYIGVSVTTKGEKDTEVIKLEQRLRDLEAKKILMIKEKRKNELEEKIRQAEEDLTVLSALDSENHFKSASAGSKHEQSNKSTPPLSSLSIEKDREEIELEQKLRELVEKKVSVLRERKKQELKEKIKQLEEDLSAIETVTPKDTQMETKRCMFCTDVLRNPKKLGCGHEFCSKCIEEAFEEACPVCGTKFGDDDDNQQWLSSDALLSWYNSSDVIENS